MSLAQRLNSCQSCFGAPSSSQMIGIGYGSQMSAAKSARPCVGDLVDETAHHLTHERSQTVGGARRERRRDEAAEPGVHVALCRQDADLLTLEEVRVGDPHQLAGSG